MPQVSQMRRVGEGGIMLGVIELSPT